MDQLTMFDAQAPGESREDVRQEAAARQRMREMIDRLRAETAPHWRDEAGVILDDGAFQRAMRLVPAEEARALWAEFDAEMERMYAVWAAFRGGSQGG